MFVFFFFLEYDRCYSTTISRSSKLTRPQSIHFFNDSIQLPFNEYDELFINDIQKTLTNIEQQLLDTTTKFQIIWNCSNGINRNQKICLDYLDNMSSLNRSLIDNVQNLLKKNQIQLNIAKTSEQIRCLTCIQYLLNRVVSYIPDYLFSITVNYNGMLIIYLYVH